MMITMMMIIPCSNNYYSTYENDDDELVNDAAQNICPCRGPRPLQQLPIVPRRDKTGNGTGTM
jgi:hypothetical protein